MTDAAETLAGIEALLVLITSERVGGQTWLFDDALQEARIRAWERLRDGHPVGIATYAARQAVIDVLRGSRMTGSKEYAGKGVVRAEPLVRQGSEGDEYAVEPIDLSTEAAIALIEARDALRGLLGALGDVDRRIVTGIYFEGLTQADLGDELGMTRQAISLRLRKALEKMRRASATRS